MAVFFILSLKGSIFMSKIIAVGNQKGGVGKTTTTLNVAAGLHAKGYRVLLIDLDPQSNLSNYLGFEKDDKPTIGDLMLRVVQNEELNALECIRKNNEGLEYIPSAISLSSADFFLVSAISRERVLLRVLKDSAFEIYDYILIDCLPSLGILLINALVCADSVLIPVQAQKFALDGLTDFLNVFIQIRNNLNEKLRVEGILLTMSDNTNMSKAVKKALEENYGEYLFQTEIRKSVEAVNSTYLQKSLIGMKNSRLGRQYGLLTTEIISKDGDL